VSPNNVSLKVRLLGGFLLISALVLVVSILSIDSLNTLNHLFKDIIHVNYPRYNTLFSVRNATNEIKNQTLILSLNEGGASSLQSIDEQKNAILANVENIHADIDFYKQHLGQNDAGAVTKLNKISQITDDVIDNAFFLISLREKQASLAAVIASEKKLTENQKALQENIDDVIEKELVKIEAEDHASEQEISQTITTMYIISMMAVILAISGGLFLSIPIAKKISKLRDAASEVARGNLDIRVNATSHDELGQLADSFDQMTQKLKEVNEQKEKNARELNKKSEELAQRMVETERINKMMIGRELTMIELKKEIEKLREQLGEKK